MNKNHNTSYNTWKNFVQSYSHNNNVHELEPHLVEAWEKCKRRVKYDDWSIPHKAKGPTFDSIKKRSNQLIYITSPIIEDVFEYFENKDCAIILSDETGCTLHMIGTSSLINELQNLGIEHGTYWREGVMGNNAISSSLHLARAVNTVGYDHYNMYLHEWAMYSAPVFNNSGRTIGCVGIIVSSNKSDDSLLPLMHSVAFSIASQISAEDVLYESNKYLTELNILLEGVDEAVLAWRSSGKVHYINNKCTELLGLDSSDLGVHIDKVITLSSRLKQSIKSGKKVDMLETTVECKGKLVTLVSSLRFFRDANGNTERFILLLYPLVHIRNIANQHSGNKAILTFDDIQFESKKMSIVLKKSIQAARSRGPILLRGEDGLDKNQIAQAIHNLSDRHKGPFISINCQAIPKQVISSEFLGDAIIDDRSSPSKFELSNGGTIFLENIEHLDTEVQAALLHLLKTGLLNLLNRNIVPIDVRVIATSNIDLEHAVENKLFRKQLLIELQTYDIAIPPLRHRLNDVDGIVKKKLSFIESEKRRKYTISDDCLNALKLYSWPGNHRELRNVIERAANFSENGQIELKDLPNNIFEDSISVQSESFNDYSNNLSVIQQKAIIRSAKKCNGKIKSMCDDLQIGRTTLWRKIKKYDIELSLYK